MEELSDIPLFEEHFCELSNQHCLQCYSNQMGHPFDTHFCSKNCYNTFYSSIQIENDYTECDIQTNDNYDENNCSDYEYDDDKSSCASDETMLSIYTYVSYGKKHRTKQLKKRIKVKTVEKYGYNYN